VSRFLRCPSPVNRQTTYRPKSCGRVLTSAESLSKIAEKERAKQEKQKKKVERMKAKEERRSMLASKVAKKKRSTAPLTTHQNVDSGDASEMNFPVKNCTFLREDMKMDMT
jgi:hypothetical protein